MAKFMRKPVVIEAVQFTLNMYNSNGAKELGVVWKDQGGILDPFIETSQGDFRINIGDWIVIPKDSPSKPYPCRADVFAQTYIPVDEA